MQNYLIKRVMTVYENYNVIAFKSCIQIFTVYTALTLIERAVLFPLLKNTKSWRGYGDFARLY